MRLCERAYKFVQIIDYKGTVRICGWIRDNEIGSLSSNSMTEIWHGEKATAIREKLARCDYSDCIVDACPYCAMDTHDEHFIEIDEVPEYPPALYLAFEEVCNYQCTSCTVADIMRRNKNHNELEAGYRNIEEKLKDVLPHVKLISANGRGELFVSKHTLKLLSEWKPLAPAEECSVRLETNGSLFDEAHWKWIENLGKYHLRVAITVMSFDESTYQFLSGTKLPITQIENNLRFVKSLREKGIIDELELATVYQERNFRFLSEFTRRCIEEFGADEVRLRPYMPWGSRPAEIEWFFDIRNPRHPYYPEFVEIMKDPIFKHPKVRDWGGGLLSEHNRIAPWERKMPIVIADGQIFFRSAEVIRTVVKDCPIIIVGLGRNGKAYLHYALAENIKVKGIFDNAADEGGKSYMGITIEKPIKYEDENIYYVITPEEPYRGELKNQLIENGVSEDKICIYYSHRNYEYMKSLPESEYQNEISEIYRERFGRDMDWENPKTYNEIINWEKLNLHDERRVRLADKVLVKDWVKEMIGEQYVVKTYGVWSDPEDIDFDALPDKFVLKTNNGSGRNIIVEDKKKLDVSKARDELAEWLKVDFSLQTLELQYRDIKPLILADEFLDGVATSAYDYNIYCFHGEPEYIWCIKGSHRPGCKASFYDKNWKMQEFSYGYPQDEVQAPRPRELDKMLELSRVLSADFEHVRVDWFILPDGRILFGEMTFSTWSGLHRFVPDTYDEVFGKLITG